MQCVYKSINEAIIGSDELLEAHQVHCQQLNLCWPVRSLATIVSESLNSAQRAPSNSYDKSTEWHSVLLIVRSIVNCNNVNSFIIHDIDDK